ncbi:MAG: Crp/Fnr family transcriptional regulator [Cyclobacteriaceae bacterium]
MDALISFFSHAGFSSAESQTLVDGFRIQNVPKGTLWVRAGQPAPYLGFLLAGSCHYYTLTPDGEERTSYVALPHTFVASLLSYLTDTPARENICAIVDCQVATISKQEVVRLCETLPAFQKFYTHLLEEQMCCMDRGRFDLITLSAEERYDKLLREEPELLRQIPLQYIASMMGITPRHLSRLRKNHATGAN